MLPIEDGHYSRYFKPEVRSVELMLANVGENDVPWRTVH